ncbi:MAG: hypothetical protein LBR27_10065 [Bifidobacteriaceae bacterium]|jgi:hypothetical protein|nr:hypothetical protein [Bifidobacteriaceae bacterium]
MRRTIAIVVVVAAALGICFGAGIAQALWGKTVTVAPASVTTSPIFVGSKGLGGDDDLVTATDSVISVPFTVADAQAIYSEAAGATGGDVMWVKPFTIAANATGTFGFSYTVSFPDLSASHYGRDVFIFPVEDAAVECDPANPPDLDVIERPLAADLTVDPALRGTYAASKTYQQDYCMAMHFVPERYTNTGVGTVEVFDGMTNTTADPSCAIAALCSGAPAPTSAGDTGANDYTQQSTWWAAVLTDPSAEPVVTFDFTVNVFQYKE